MEIKDFDLFSKLLGLSIKKWQKIGWQRYKSKRIVKHSNYLWSERKQKKEKICELTFRYRRATKTGKDKEEKRKIQIKSQKRAGTSYNTRPQQN